MKNSYRRRARASRQGPCASTHLAPYRQIPLRREARSGSLALSSGLSSLTMRARCSRRALLLAGLAGAAGAVLPRRARAFGEASRLSFALLRHGGRWDTRPDALPRLAWEGARRTSIDTPPTGRSRGAAAPELFRPPFAVLASDAAVPALGEAEAAGLRRYLSYGGFLLVDDASGVRDGGFDASVRELLRRVLPGAALTPVPRDHVLYKSFYLLDGPAGRVSAAPDLLGLELGGRLGVLYSQNAM